MSFSTAEIFKIGSEFEEEFGKIHPHILPLAGDIWQKSGEFFSRLINDQSLCLKTLMQATALVSRKYYSGENEIKSPTAYLYSTFRHLILAEITRQKRHSELEIEAGSEQIEINSENDEKIYQKVLINQLRARMDEWTREVFDLQTIGYKYKDLIPRYGLSENIIRSKYSKNISKLKNEIQAEMAEIDKELKING